VLPLGELRCIYVYVCMYVCMYESICNALLLQPKQSRVHSGVLQTPTDDYDRRQHTHCEQNNTGSYNMYMRASNNVRRNLKQDDTRKRAYVRTPQ